MQVRRQFNKIFGSLRRKKPREKKSDSTTSGSSSSSSSSVPFSRSFSLRKSKKENSLSRCQLLDGYDDDNNCHCPDEISDSVSLSNNNNQLCSPGIPAAKPKTIWTVQLPDDTCQLEPAHQLANSAVSTRTEGKDNIIFVSDSCGNGSNEKAVENPAVSGEHSATEPTADCNRSSVEDDCQGDSKTGAKANKSKGMTVRNKSALVSFNVSGLRFTMMELRKSAKRFRKAVKSGIVDWAESMSHYSATAIPELYECPYSAPTSHYYADYADCNRFEQSPWFYRHSHYHIEQRCHRQALQANHLNQCCQLSY